jgi:serine/threonine protein kinase, bacterial
MSQDVLLSNRYHVVERIGCGGMQEVFLATDTLIGSSVALKTPLPGQASNGFAKSAKISARVNSHHIAKTLDYFEEEGKPYLVEEYIDGDDLDQRLGRLGVFEPHLAAKVFHHLAKGVAVSHHAGVIHRDLKPSNILVGKDINLDNLKITDFGIAALAEEVFEQAAQGGGDLTRSTSGTIRGALPYMAPEMMFRSDALRPDKPADIWSLGAMMFKLLTGQVPFGVYLEAAVNVKNQQRKEWPDFMTRKSQYKKVAIDIKDVVDKCLDYDPENRPTADELTEKIGSICYINQDRMTGRINNMIQNGFSGFITAEDGASVFFSKESVYGPKSASAKAGDEVVFSCFPGSPKPRAHPVMVLKRD